MNLSVYPWRHVMTGATVDAVEHTGHNGETVAEFVHGQLVVEHPDPDDPSNEVPVVEFPGGRVPLGHFAHRATDGRVVVTPRYLFLQAYAPSHHH